MKIIEHYAIYKPYGVVSQFYTNDLKANGKVFLSDVFPNLTHTMPIGRLDENSEGLLLLTTNGKLSNFINSADVVKSYFAVLDGSITNDAIAMLKLGVTIGLQGKKYITKGANVNIEELPNYIPTTPSKIRIGGHRPNSCISIAITEGKYRQVRKMTAAVGFPTLRLVRDKIGPISLKQLSKNSILPMPNLPELIGFTEI